MLTTEIHADYITDSAGQRKFAVLSMEDYENLLEDVHDLALAAERKSETAIAHAELVHSLKSEGLL